MHTYIHTQTHTHIHIYIYIHIYLHTHAHTNIGFSQSLVIAWAKIYINLRIFYVYRSHLDGHCLGVLFSNKAFPSRVLGLAWKGDPKKQSGICQKRRKEVQLKNYKVAVADIFTT
jgi:hypothetical protein